MVKKKGSVKRTSVKEVASVENKPEIDNTAEMLKLTKRLKKYKRSLNVAVQEDDEQSIVKLEAKIREVKSYIEKLTD